VCHHQLQEFLVSLLNHLNKFYVILAQNKNLSTFFNDV
jgi:hypothetical protein